MAGLLSNLFESDGGMSGQNDLGGDLHLDPTVSVHLEQDVTYQGLDGSTHSWSNETDLTANVDVDAALGASSAYDVGQTGD
jgi:hypothetical protein